VAPGDKFVLYQPRLGRTFDATVTAEGALQTEDGTVYNKPSPAAKACTGYEMNGYVNWRHRDRRGPTINELNRQAHAMGF
jgi:hypothetical protein